MEVLNEYRSEHLTNEEQIKVGSFYTPKPIVDFMHSLIKDYTKRPNVVIFDSAAGAGAFLEDNQKDIFKVADCDENAIEFLKKKVSKKNIFTGNSLLNVCRAKYKISDSDFLIQIGNPPYNDTTSFYKNGQKGRNLSDQDLRDRDMGVSFLKSYNKLKSDVVCVLHPLSYLIKEANFKRLGAFRENYCLKKGFIFSSHHFHNTGNTHFPIVISLYERTRRGIAYEDIKDFEFNILDTKNKLRLSEYQFTDSFIRKYPPKKTDKQISDINLYYYTFRDINSLIRNRDFHTAKCYNSIVVQLEDLYKYSYLYSFKKLFRPKDLWVYGNLSPLGDSKTLEKNKRIFIEYFLESSKVARDLKRETIKRIATFYKITYQKENNNLKEIEERISRLLIESIQNSVSHPIG